MQIVGTSFPSIRKSTAPVLWWPSISSKCARNHGRSFEFHTLAGVGPAFAFDLLFVELFDDSGLDCVPSSVSDMEPYSSSASGLSISDDLVEFVSEVEVDGRPPWSNESFLYNANLLGGSTGSGLLSLKVEKPLCSCCGGNTEFVGGESESCVPAILRIVSTGLGDRASFRLIYSS